MQALLRADLQRHGLLCSVYGRTKEVASLLKKVLRKSYGAPYDEIHDKLGVRVIVTFADDVPVVEEVIRGRFVVQKYENKTLGLESHELGYLGVHFEVSLRDGDLADGRWRDLVAEVQVHTRAQNCWADVSHRLLYKPAQETPVEIRRRIYRLMALIELFDETVRDARRAIAMLPGAPEAGVLMELEQHFYEFVARPYDRELSLEIVKGLGGLYDSREREEFADLIARFVERNREKLDEIFDAYRDDERCNPLLFQPEALLVFERLEHDSFRLRSAWTSAFPLALLENLATIWGRAI